MQPFLNDARALASPNLSLLLVGNKLDLASDEHYPPPTPSSVSSSSTAFFQNGGVSVGSGTSLERSGTGTISRGTKATVAPEGREVSSADASRWASTVNIPVVMETSAFTGEGVDEIFTRLAGIILTKIELGEIDPDDPMSGIQYGDGYGGGWHGGDDGASIKSSMTAGTLDEAGGVRRRRNNRGRARGGNTNWGLREWEEVFTLTSRRRGNGCC